MKNKGVIIPTSSGYFEDALLLSDELSFDVDASARKATEKIEDALGRYKYILQVGNVMILNSVVMTKEAVKKIVLKKVVKEEPTYEIEDEIELYDDLDDEDD